MEFTCKVSLDNAAFEDHANELARILRKLADMVEGTHHAETSALVFDINGNRCGRWEIS